MKPLLILIFFFVSHYMAIAQGTQGVITYERTSNYIKIISRLDFLSQEEKDRAKLTWGTHDGWKEKIALYFNEKETIANHILMIGDTAALIHPLCGNGMAIAIHSAKIASTLLVDYTNGRINSREKLEQRYDSQWKKAFNFRLRNGRIIAWLFRQASVINFIMKILIRIPILLRYIIRLTHGKPLNPN